MKPLFHRDEITNVNDLVPEEDCNFKNDEDGCLVEELAKENIEVSVIFIKY